MADRKREVGSDSPGSRSAKKQRTGEPRPAKQSRRKSGRRGSAREHETVRRGYEAAREPEPQADGDPGRRV